MLKTLRVVVCFLLAVFLRPEASTAQNQTTSPAFPEKLYSAMRWRSIGPFRGGRVLAVSGVANRFNRRLGCVAVRSKSDLCRHR
jgi:hypothetical protein